MSFDKTPSFYNDNETFRKYLGNSSYYRSLQNAIIKIIEFSNVKTILEMGCGTGNTSIKIAERFPNIQIDAIDMREDIIAIAKSDGKHIKNASFYCAEMCEYAKTKKFEYDLVFLLYSFHHIEDPLENKITFLNNCYLQMKDPSYLVILETFLPDNCSMNNKCEEILQLWERRSQEGYASTFWEALQGIDENSIFIAKEIGEFLRKNENHAGELVYKRENEYLINSQWLCDVCRRIGFEILLCEPCNSVNEKVVLLKKA